MGNRIHNTTPEYTRVLLDRIDEEELSRDGNPRTAAVTAVHIVNQVLDEACDIANAAQDSGQPWRYLSMQKNIKNNNIGCIRDEDESFESSKGDAQRENNVEVVANIVATSTPQKNAPRQSDCSDELTEFNDSTLIGQGDQDIGPNDNTLTNSTSIFINNLFDMSELERAITCDDRNENLQGTSEANNLLSDEAYTKIMENYVNYLFPPMEDKPAFMSTFNPFLSSILPEENVEDNIGEPHRDQSEYLFLADASVADIGRDVGFYIEEDGSADRDRVYESLETDVYEFIRNPNTDEEAYEGVRTGIAYEDYENQQTTASDTESFKDLRPATDENDFYEDLQSVTIGEDKGLQNVTDSSEVNRGQTFSSVKEIKLTTMVKEDYRTQDTAKVEKNYYESQKTATHVEISKDSRTATVKMEVFEGLKVATDKNEVYKGLQTVAIEDIHDNYQTATIEKEIHKGLQSEPVDIDKSYERPQTAEELKQEVDDVEKEAIKQKNDFELYEKAYMTLNRDYDQNSEDDGYPILQDPKEMVLQEVELMTHPSEEELQNVKTSVPKPKEEDATTSGVSEKSKSTLARRCRLQGARLFARIRGWWRRKTPGKRREMRKASLGVCPLSPDARRRSSSLLDSRHLRSPSPSRPVLWKFNTVNEALVNSNRWKEYTFDAMAEGSDQF